MMSQEETNKILNELHEVNVEHLEDKAKNLFYAIMKIADERDESKQRIDKATKYSHEQLGFFENCVGGDESQINQIIRIHNYYLSVLQDKEMK